MWPKSGFEKKVFIKMVIKLKIQTSKKDKKGHKQAVCPVSYTNGYKFDKHTRVVEPRRGMRADPCSSHRGHGHSPNMTRRTDSGLANIKSPHRERRSVQHNYKDHSREYTLKAPKLEQAKSS